MGEALKNDFSRVRVHTDKNAAELNRRLGVRAFAMGKDVFFGKGGYQPENRQGNKQIAHKMVHREQHTPVFPEAAWGVYKAEAAPGASPPPLTAADIEITYGPNADSSVVSVKSLGTIKIYWLQHMQRLQP